MAFAAVVALGVLAPTATRAAEVKDYKFSAPVCAKGPYDGFTLFQGGDLNNKGQFTFNMVYSGGDGGERIHAWDGTKVVQISGNDKALPDGATWNTGNVWTPHGINDLGHVVFTGDVTDGTGPHYVLEYDLATGAYTILARPTDPAPGGGNYAN